MEGMGCLLFVGAVIVGIVGALIANSSANAKRRAAAQAAARQRGERIVRLLDYVSRTAGAQREKALTDLYAELSAPPIGFVPELTGAQGWFGRGSAALSACLRDPAAAYIVEWYFRCFTFPAGSLHEVMSWLSEHLSPEAPVDLNMLARVAERALSSGSAADAEELYDRTLKALPERKDERGYKAFVLRIGRFSHAFGRADRRATVYDELAIANDIAMNL